MRRSILVVSLAIAALASLAGCGKERVSTEATPREREIRGAAGSMKGVSARICRRRRPVRASRSE